MYLLYRLKMMGKRDFVHGSEKFRAAGAKLVQNQTPVEQDQ